MKTFCYPFALCLSLLITGCVDIPKSIAIRTPDIPKATKVLGEEIHGAARDIDISRTEPRVKAELEADRLKRRSQRMELRFVDLSGAFQVTADLKGSDGTQRIAEAYYTSNLPADPEPKKPGNKNDKAAVKKWNTAHAAWAQRQSTATSQRNFNLLPAMSHPGSYKVSVSAKPLAKDKYGKWLLSIAIVSVDNSGAESTAFLRRLSSDSVSSDFELGTPLAIEDIPLKREREQ
jgi:hypothetical protein